MQRIGTCLWFDKNAEEAVKFYTSLFPNVRVGATAHYGEAGAKVSGQPKGSVMTIEFDLEGVQFLALNGGPIFKFNPSISLFVNCQTEAEIDKLYNALSDGGTIMMEYQKYPWSEKYCWLNDKFGLSWQLNLGTRTQKVAPAIMFFGDNFGKAEEAINYYVSLFQNSKVFDIARYQPGEGGVEGKVKYSVFSLNGQDFMMMENNFQHGFGFNESVSFMVNCDSQEEVDTMWKKLSAGGETGHCGWLKDKYGVSWQVIPRVLNEMLKNADAAKSEKVMQAMLQMNKLEIEPLQKAYQR